MKVITCASYHGTGSSALTDLITEYDGVKSLGDYEFPFAYSTDGLSDLEYHLVEFQDRHSSGHALKRFEKLSRFNSGTWFNKRYEPYFNNQYWDITKEYIEKLLSLKIPGQTLFDTYDRGVWFHYVQSFVKKLFLKIGFNIQTLPNEFIYFSHLTEEDFLNYTRQYTTALLKAANKDDAPFLMIDQLVPSQNIKRCLRYFNDNVYVIVVDRDPRDVYISSKYVWHDQIVPHDPESFCKWFRYTHETTYNENMDNSRVIRINFEDLIYNYYDTRQEIEEFLGLDKSVKKYEFTHLNPKRSVVNTMQWKKYGTKSEVTYIEEHLKDYLFPFEKYSNSEIVGIEPQSVQSF